MKKYLSYGLMVAGVWLGLGTASHAIPGQSVDDVETWMKAHPTLRATARERLLVNRVDTPARRFSFQATVFPAGGYANTSDEPPILNADIDRSTVRTEKFTLIDMVDGVSIERLEESLRLIYGPDVYADYRRALPVYSYPASSPSSLLRPGRDLVRGELREGEDLAYWLELTPNPDGTVHIGTISVLLREDLGSLRSRLGDNDTP
ncbi:MAG: hypothetical protein AAFV72_12760 [Cyanobacteria bacterium J06635_1]